MIRLILLSYVNQSINNHLSKILSYHFNQDYLLQSELFNLLLIKIKSID